MAGLHIGTDLSEHLLLVFAISTKILCADSFIYGHSQNADIVTHIKGRLLKRSVVIIKILRLFSFQRE